MAGQEKVGRKRKRLQEQAIGSAGASRRMPRKGQAWQLRVGSGGDGMRFDGRSVWTTLAAVEFAVEEGARG